MTFAILACEHDEKLTRRTISYRSDADMSKDEVMLGLMEISSLSLPDEPHKYFARIRRRMTMQ